MPVATGELETEVVTEEVEEADTVGQKEEVREDAGDEDEDRVGEKVTVEERDELREEEDRRVGVKSGELDSVN